MSDEIFKVFTNIDLLTSLGYASLVFSIFAIIIILYHWRFFKSAEKTEISKRMMLVFLSDFLMYGSIALYGLNWVLFDGGTEFRLLLKIIQVFAIMFNLYALVRLARFYIEVK